jgi:two-component system response regulator MprA
MKRILVIEDDKNIATALAIRLEAANYDVMTAPNGLEGLKQILENQPDLILMDIWMPAGLGFSVAQRLRGLGLSGIPLVFITASKLPGLREIAKGLGAVAFFEKPYDPDQLLESISGALRSKELPIMEQTRPVAASVC